MAEVVLHTYGIFHEPRNREQNQGFHDRNPFVYTSAETSVGFVDSSGNSCKGNHADGNRDWNTREVSPRFFTGEDHHDTAATLSVREDVEVIYAFTYNGFPAGSWASGTSGLWPGGYRMMRLPPRLRKPSAWNTCMTTDRPPVPLISKLLSIREGMDREKIQARSKVVQEQLRRE